MLFFVLSILFTDNNTYMIRILGESKVLSQEGYLTIFFTKFLKDFQSPPPFSDLKSGGIRFLRGSEWDLSIFLILDIIYPQEWKSGNQVWRQNLGVYFQTHVRIEIYFYHSKGFQKNIILYCPQ